MLIFNEKHKNLHQFTTYVNGIETVICEVVNGRGKNNLIKLVKANTPLTPPQRFLVRYSVEKLCRLIAPKYQKQPKAHQAWRIFEDIQKLINLNEQFFWIVNNFVNKNINK